MLRLPLSHVRAGRYRTRTAAEPTATTTSTASGGSSEELLGPRPAIRKQGAADAGCRNPSACGGNREARLGPRSDFSRPRQGAAEKISKRNSSGPRTSATASVGMSAKKAPPAGAPFAEPRLGGTGQEQCTSEPFVKNKGRVSSWRWYPASFAILRILGQLLRTQEKGQALTYRGVLSLAGVIYSAQQIGIYLEVLDNEIKEHFNCC